MAVDSSSAATEAEACPSGRKGSVSSPSSPTTATFAKTGTSSSASQKRARIFPAAVDSRSKLALSVSITASTSPSATASPTLTFHSVRIQLSTDCPWRGMMIGVAISIILSSFQFIQLNRTLIPLFRNDLVNICGNFLSEIKRSTASQSPKRAKHTFSALLESANKITLPACLEMTSLE